MSVEEAMKILGITDVNYSADELKKAYRKMAMGTHPDRFKDNLEKNEQMQKVNEAREVLEIELQAREQRRSTKEKMSTAEYRKMILDDIHKRLFADGNKIRNDFKINKKHREEISKYNPSGIDELMTSVQNIYENAEALILFTTDKDKIDNIAQNFYSDLREVYQKFINETLNAVEEEMQKSELPINNSIFSRIRVCSLNVVSFRELIFGTNSGIMEIMNWSRMIRKRDAEAREFNEYKKEKLKEYTVLADKLPKDSVEFKNAGAIYQKLFGIKNRGEFDKEYEIDLKFLRMQVREHYHPIIENLRLMLNQKYFTAIADCSLEDNLKMIKVLECAIEILNHDFITEAQSNVLSRINFSDIDADIDLLREYRGIPKEAVFIRKSSETTIIPKVTYFISEGFDLYSKEIYLDDTPHNELVRENSDGFSSEYINLIEFFKNASKVGLVTVDNKEALLEYNGLTLCRFKREYSYRYFYEFVSSDQVKATEKEVSFNERVISAMILGIIEEAKLKVPDEIRALNSKGQKIK